jgi:hypothetical protein
MHMSRTPQLNTSQGHFQQKTLTNPTDRQTQVKDTANLTLAKVPVDRKHLQILQTYIHKSRTLPT